MTSIAMKNITLFFILASLAVFNACDEEIPYKNQDHSATSSNEPSSSSVIRLEEPYLSNLKEHGIAYFELNASGDFNRFLDYTYPGIFSEEITREDVVEMLQSYRDAGMEQIVKNVEIKHVSELVEDKENLVSLMIAYVEHDIVLSGSYAENPKSIEAFVRDKYGKDNYSYDEASKTYHVAGNVNLYALTPKDTVNFTFLNDQYVNSPQLVGLLEYPTIEKLRKFVVETY